MGFPKELAYLWNGQALHKQQCFHWSAKTVCCFLSCDFCGSCDITQQALQPAIMNAIANAVGTMYHASVRFTHTVLKYKCVEFRDVNFQ